MHHQITIIGPIASGKTTTSQFLSEKLSLPLIDADLYETNPFLSSYIEDNSRWSFATELFFTIGRLKKLRPLRTMLRKSSVIVDSGLIMSHQVYTKNHLVQGTMTASEWDFFSTIIADYQNHLPTPDLVIQLLTSPRTQLRRIKARGRTFEKGYTLEYLSSITDRLDEYARSLANNPAVTLLPFSTEEHNISTPTGAKALLRLIKSNL
ncbi:MAG: deoxynucleoside kinase [bacterium]